MLAIDRLYREYFPSQEQNAPVLDDQFSLFDEARPVDEDTSRFSPAPASAPLPVQPAVPEEAEQLVAETVEELANPAPAPASTADAVEEVFQAANAEAIVKQDDVDSFLEDFSVPAELPPEEEPYKEAPYEEEPAYPEEEPEALPYREEARTVRKPRVFLLILFVLLAVPITLAGVVLLLVPTLLVLALAAACIVAGAAVLVAAFSGFQILADFLLLCRAAVGLRALALLARWLFVWFIGGAIAGLISGVIGLGQSWCYKEVSA